jgi:hypothetical protein
MVLHFGTADKCKTFDAFGGHMRVGDERPQGYGTP